MSGNQSSIRFTANEAILESLRDAIVIVDSDGRIEMCNLAAERLFDRDREEICGRSMDQFLRNSGLGISSSPVVFSPEECNPAGTRVDMQAVDADGNTRPVEVAIADLAGATNRLCLVISDVKVERRIVMQAAKLSVLQQLVTRATTALITSSKLNDTISEALGAIGNILDVAHAFVFRIRSFDGAQTITTSAEWRSNKVDPDSHGLMGGALLRNAEIREQLEADGVVTIVDSTDDNGEVAELIRRRGVRSMILLPICCPDVLEGVLAFDETRRGRAWTTDERAVLLNLAQALARSIERIRAQSSLEEARKRSNEALVRAEAASEAKSEFLANVSHELRTPLTAIVGYADLAGRANTSPTERLDMCVSIQRSADFLLGVINDILDISKIESRKMAVTLESVNLRELIHDVGVSLSWIAQDKGLEIRAEYLSEVPTMIVSDATRLRQILVNLVSNALKFTSEGGVTISVSCQGSAEPRSATLTLNVTDTGIGIRAHKIRELFSKFTQVHEDRKYGGTGLGLAITRHLARLLSGDVEVRSEFGKGSTFTVTVPVTVPDDDQIVRENLADEHAKDLEAPRLAVGTRVLVADDNEDNRKIFRFVLEDAGAEVTTVENGREALDALQLGEDEEQPYEVVFLDMSMPVLDGYEAARLYRKQGGKRRVVALTAFSMTTDRDKCIASGCDGYLTKPIRPDALVRAAVKYGGGGDQVAAGAGAGVDQIGENGPPIEGLLSLEASQDYEDLLAVFRDVLGQRMEQIWQAFKEGNADRLRVLVHKLKGSSGCYGFTDLTAVLSDCESALRSGQLIGSLASELQEVDRLVEIVRGGGGDAME